MKKKLLTHVLFLEIRLLLGGFLGYTELVEIILYLMKTIVVNDKIFGKQEIRDPLFLDIINTKSFQRLKGLCQFGLPDELYHLKGFTRFDHSLGALFLLEKFGASREEKLAGLLHDISHTAFSHIIDWVYRNWETEDWQDSNHFKFISEDEETVAILERNNFDVEKICDLERYELLDKPAPDLCADRLDYSLREIIIDSDAEKINKYLNDLDVSENKIIFFKTEKIALEFSLAYLKLQEEHWGGYEAANRYLRVARVVRDALDKKFIDENDFYLEDRQLIKRICKSKDDFVLREIEKLKRKQSEDIGKIQGKKFRYIDPMILKKDGLTRLSSVDEDFKRKIDEARIKNKKGVKI